ncbi:MAG: hypothetical protein GWM92_19570, partial [Gemmatimonadetes bacterium]|nr:hypothetical protein [Gemmatimonadota bacterium]NIR77712.1 hypothetical protein [Gemmatimonadota bacterium]NIT89837.1 hypothetical protein [Gemmatimonadota bacterium]NIU30084.1 hypothetical protein [Gemmatimonadota bacterium]NIU35035.1 hypothetical protein [Gemmatimonadota bacterium]
PALPILFVSGYDRTDLLHGAFDELDAPFLEKPYDLERLAEKVRALLRV